jgi:pentapeptide MXKDX repeat protein
MNIKYLLAAALTMTSLAFAAPAFTFGKDATANMMMKSDNISVAAYPSAKLLGRNITKNSAILIFELKTKTAAHDLFFYYEAALMKDGWKNAAAAAMMKGDTMMAGDAMKGDAMKPDAMKPDAMKPDTMKPDTMKPDAMKPDTMMAGDAMKGNTMMAGMDKTSYTANFVLKTYTISLSTKTTGDRVTVLMSLK